MSKLFISVFVVAAIAISCNKELSATNDPTTKPVTDSSKYMSFTPTSSWTYQEIDHTNKDTSEYILTSTNRDTIVAARTYHVFTDSDSSNILYNITGNDYYTFSNLTASLGGKPIEMLYLKDSSAINTSWNQSYSISVSGLPVVITLTNIIAEKNINKIINGITYPNVIHVNSKISATTLGIPVPDNTIKNTIDYYFAKKYGMIQGIRKVSFALGAADENTDIEINLLKANIK